MLVLIRYNLYLVIVSLVFGLFSGTALHARDVVKIVNDWSADLPPETSLTLM